MRTVRVIRPAGGKVVQFEASNDLTWETLEPMLIDLGIATQNVQIIVSGSGNAINTSPASKVPDGNIMLGIKQTKLPFGASYNEMKSVIRDKRKEAELSGDTNTVNLIGDYTRMKREQLTALYEQLTESTVSVVDTTEVNQLKDRVTNLEAQVVELRRRINDLEENTVVNEEDDDEDLYQDEEDDDNGMTDEDRAFLQDFNLV